MPNRFNAKPKEMYGVQPLPTGYPENGVTSELVIPPVGIEDVDIAMFNLFDTDIPLTVGGSGEDLKKVPVIFAGGEKWALIKRNRVLRDKNGTLILPLIAVGRSGFSQESNSDITGRGINQRTGEIVIRRKLDKSDRGYQNLINRIFLKNQSVTAVGSNDSIDGQVETSRTVGELADDPIIVNGGSLLADRTNNVYETLVIPSPQFFTANYDIFVWTQYTHHMNQIMETLISSFLPQTQGWRIDTPKGYWFVAQCEESLYNAETNFDDMSQSERIIRYKFTVKVPAYILASNAPGVPIPVKRYVSSPMIKFETSPIPVITGNENINDPFIGADDPTLPLADSQVRNRDQRRDGKTRLYVSGRNIDPNDPALNSNPRGRELSKYKKLTVTDGKGNKTTTVARVISTNTTTGETVYSPSHDLGGLTIVVTDD